MPIYEYRCADCDRHFERYVTSTSGTAACPACGGTEVKRMLSVFALKSESPVASTVPSGGGGACCGGGCSCH